MQTFEKIVKFYEDNSQLEGHEPDHVCIIICDPNLPWDSRDVALTWQSVYRWKDIRESTTDITNIRNNIIFSQSIDNALNRADKYKYAFIIYAGRRCRVYSVKRRFDVFKQSGISLEAPFKWENDNYPTIEPKIIFLNIEDWRKNGRPQFAPYTGHVVTLADYMVGEMCIIADPDCTTKHYVESKSSAHIISSTIKNDCIITCFFDDNIPLNNNPPVSDLSNTIYLFNNQLLRSRSKSNVRHTFDVIYSPASGSIAEFAWKEYGHSNTKLVIYDDHLPSLLWKQTCYKMVSTFGDIVRACDNISREYKCKIDRSEYRQHVVDANRKTFPDDEWASTFAQIRDVEFLHRDIIEQPLVVDSTHKTLIYTSNIFEYSQRILHMDIEHIHKQFLFHAHQPNTVFFGQNVLNEPVFIDNIN